MQKYPWVWIGNTPRDFGLDQYISWNLSNEELCLDTIWQKFEEFCKPQTYELRARIDLLTSFQQGDMSVNQWYNAVQHQVNLAKYPSETAKILQRDIFLFFSKWWRFSKTINESNIDLEKFPASKVRQLAKKLDSSKSIARQIKTVTSEPPAAQINLLRHQRTEIPPSEAQRKQNKFRPKPNFKRGNHHQANYQPNEGTKKKFNPKQIHQNPERCHKCGDSKHAEGFQCSARTYQCKHCHKFGHFSSLCYKKQESYKKKTGPPKAYQLTCGRLSTPDSSISSPSSDTSFSEDEPFCLQMKIQEKKPHTSVQVPKHLVTNLEFKVQPHKRKPSF